MENILIVSNLSMHFEDKVLFDKINFSLPKGSMTALLGANGTGKTTLTRILLGILTPSAGTVTFAKNIRLGYVPQFRNIDPDYPLCIKSFVELNAPLFKNAATKKHVHNVLRATDLLAIQNTRMGEATASLDPVAKEELMKLITHFNEKHKMTVLFVTHDIPLAKKYMRSYLLLKDQNVQTGAIQDLHEEVGS